MTFNPFLNLRFVRILHNLKTSPYTKAEIFAAARVHDHEDLAFAARCFRQDHVTNARGLEGYLTNHRDVNAWKVGAFKFFHEYYKAYPDSLARLSLKNDAREMESFIDNIVINPALESFYDECGHDPHLALKYSVSKVICDERRLGWMNLFCGKFSSLLDLDDDTGIIAQDLVDQIDFVDAAEGLGFLTEKEYQDLLNRTGSRIVKMFPSWGRFLAGVLLSRLYTYCISSAEVRYIPNHAQEIIDNFYLCCNNDLVHLLPIPGWENDDLKDLKEALKPFVSWQRLDKLWESNSPKELDSISKVNAGFDFYKRKLLPIIEEREISNWFREFSKYDEFITVASGSDFHIYYDSLHLPLQEDEFPIFIMRFNMFTNKGIWNFSPYTDVHFMEWPEKITVSNGLPVVRDLGNCILPVSISELNCDMELQLPYAYKCDSYFVRQTSEAQASSIAKDIDALKFLFTELPKLCRE